MAKGVRAGFKSLLEEVKLNIGSDAVARVAEGKTTSGNIVCPVVKLAPSILRPIYPTFCNPCGLFLTVNPHVSSNYVSFIVALNR